MRRERGTAAVEMVLIAPALLVLLSSVLGAGRLVQTKSILVQVAREGARAGSSQIDARSAESVARDRAREVADELGLDPSRLRVAADAGSFRRGDPLTVTARYEVRLGHLPRLGVISRRIELRARHAEVIERWKSR